MNPHPALTAALLLASTAASSRAADPRADFLKLISRPPVALAIETKTEPAKDGLIAGSLAYSSDADNRVPGIFLKPVTPSPDTRLPVVICLHGTGGTKESQRAFMTDLARAGFFAVAIDGRYHGARTKAGKGSSEYSDAILRAYRSPGQEHPFFFDTVWDVMRLIDYLVSRPDVDPARIGLFGISKGGIETYLTAAVDPRVAAAVPCIAVESFRWADEHDAWQSRIGTIQVAFDAAARDAGIARPDGRFVHDFYARVAPEIDGEFDGPSLVPLIAPRPLLAINGEIDPRTPMPGLQLCAAATRTAYHAAGADDRFELKIQPRTGHKVLPESLVAARDWFVRWLQPAPASVPAAR